MATATLTSKGQITIPAEVREDLGLVSGSKVTFIKTGSGEYTLKVKKGSIWDLRGFFKATTEPATVEQMNDAIAEHVIEDWNRQERQWAEERKGTTE